MKITIDMVMQFMQERIPFNRFLAMEVTALETGFCRIEIPFRDELVGDPFRPALHGGVLSTLADTTGGGAVWTEIETFDRVSTVDLRIDYLRPGPLERIACEARVVRIGNRVGVADMSCFAVSKPEQVIAVGKGVYSVKRHKPGE
ncbi:MAG: hotdog fold thioesterase [Myxococcales bacterium]|nr:hotdog fold thioesterase [Myxococcales bacterium]